MKRRFINKLIALLIGFLMNPVLLIAVFLADAHGGNIADSGAKGTLLERTSFAYIYFWSSVVVPDDSRYFEVELLLAVISNTILYTILSYIWLNYLDKAKRAKQ